MTRSLTRGVARRRGLALTTLAVGTAVLLTACSGSPDAADPSESAASSDTSETPAGDDLSSLVPDELKGTTISAVIGDSNPPLYSRNEAGDITGITFDLGTAAADLLGLKLDVQANSFESSIPGLQSGTYDISLWATDITAERLQVIDQIPVGTIGYTFLTPEGSDLGTDMDDLCGLTIAAIAGQTTLPLLEEQSGTCTDAGKDAITVSTFADQASAGLAVKSGRADAATVNSVSGLYIADQDKELGLSGPIFNAHLTGIAADKGSPLSEAFAAALQELVDNGTYAEVLATYGAEAFAIDSIELNPSVEG